MHINLNSMTKVEDGKREKQYKLSCSYKSSAFTIMVTATFEEDGEYDDGWRDCSQWHLEISTSPVGIEALVADASFRECLCDSIGTYEITDFEYWLEEEVARDLNAEIEEMKREKLALEAEQEGNDG